MTKHIGRQISIGIGKEAVRGTAVASDFWVESLGKDHKEMREYVNDDAALGTIFDSSGAEVVKEWAEGGYGAHIGSEHFGLILLNLFGGLSSATKGGETVVYEHTYTLQEDAQHDSLTIEIDQPNGDKNFPLAMLSNVEIAFELGKILDYTAGFMSKKGADDTLTPAFTVENKFRPQDFELKIADTLAITEAAEVAADGDATVVTYGSLAGKIVTVGSNVFTEGVDWDAETSNDITATNLAAAIDAVDGLSASAVAAVVTVTTDVAGVIGNLIAFSTDAGAALTVDAATLTGGTGVVETCVKSFNVTFEKNLEADHCMGDVDPQDFLNKQLTITGSIVLNYDSNVFEGYFENGTTKSMRLALVKAGTTIGVGSNPSLVIGLEKVSFQEISFERGNDALVTQELTFKAHYNLTNSQGLDNVVLTNLTASY